MQTREKIIVIVIFKFINFFISNHKKRAILLNKIFSNFNFSNNVNIRRNVTFYGKGSLIIGENSFINEECFLDLSSKIIIGNDVALGMRTMVLSSSHNIGIKRCGEIKRKCTVIKNNVWIGAGVTIYPGIIIGEGSIISAGEIVDVNVPDNVILKQGKFIKLDESKLK